MGQSTYISHISMPNQPQELDALFEAMLLAHLQQLSEFRAVSACGREKRLLLAHLTSIGKNDTKKRRRGEGTHRQEIVPGANERRCAGQQR